MNPWWFVLLNTFYEFFSGTEFKVHVECIYKKKSNFIGDFSAYIKKMLFGILDESLSLLNGKIMVLC